MLQYEQMPKLVTLPIIGLPLAKGWSQICENSNHSLVFAIAISGNNSANIGRDISQKIKQLNIKKAQELHQFSLDLLIHINKLGNQIQFAGMYLTDQTYTFITFNGTILLKRANKIGKILSAQPELQIIQGKVHTDDVLILATQKTHPFLKEIQLKLEQGFEADMIATSLITAIHNLENSSQCAIAITKQEKIKAKPDKNLTINLDLDFADVPEHSLKPNEAVTNSVKKIQINTNKPIVKNKIKNEAVVKKIAKIPLSPKIPAMPAKPAKQFIPKQDIKLTLPDLKLGNKISTGLKILQKTAKGLWQAVKKIAKKTKSKISQKHQYIEKINKRKKWQFGFIIMVIITIMALAFFITIQLKKQQLDQAQKQAQPAILILEQAKNETERNPFKARELSQQSIEQLQQILPAFENKKHAYNYIDKELATAKQFYETISGKEELQQLSVFLDLQKLDQKFLASLVAVNDQYLALIDKQQKSLLVYLFDQKTSTQFSLEELKDFSSIILADNHLYLLGNGLCRLDFNFTDEEPKLNIIQLKEQGDSDRSGKYLQKFGTYLYIFNPEKRNIYRYSINKDTLSDPIGWLISKKDLVFADITSMAVDGDLWLSTNDGQVKKFTKGAEDNNFTLQGLPNELKSEVIIYTNENLQNLYILVKNESKLLIFNKQGEFQKEIESPSLASVTDIAVSEKLNKAFAISGSVVFEIGL